MTTIKFLNSNDFRTGLNLFKKIRSYTLVYGTLNLTVTLCDDIKLVHPNCMLASSTTI